MPIDISSKTEVEQLISQALQEPSWPFDLATQILFLIQLHHLLNNGELNECLLNESMEKSRSFLVNGIKTGDLHDVSPKRNDVSKAIATAATVATGVVALSSPAILAILAPIIQQSSMASLISRNTLNDSSLLSNNTHKISNIERSVFIPAEIKMYAEKKGKWLVGSLAPKTSQDKRQKQSEIIETKRAKSVKPSTCIDSTEASIKMSDKLWGENRKMKESIEAFVRKEALKANCICSHKQMYDIVYHATDSDNSLLLDISVVSEPKALELIKIVFSEIAPNRIIASRPPKKNYCPVHGAK